jgi:hypothetical protein
LYLQVLEKCWEHDPGKRPKFKEFAKRVGGDSGNAPPLRDVGEALAEAEADAIADASADYESASLPSPTAGTAPASPAAAASQPAEPRPRSEYSGFDDDETSLQV